MVMQYGDAVDTDTCSLRIGVLTPKIYVAHYAQTVSAEWLLLTGHRRLQMPYLTPPLPSLPFPPNMGTELTHFSYLLAFAHPLVYGRPSLATVGFFVISNGCVDSVAVYQLSSDSEDGAVDPWINRGRQAVIYRKRHPEHRAHHYHAVDVQRQVLSASPASDDHESLLRSEQLNKCTLNA